MTLHDINNLSFEAAYIEFHRCCGAKKWVSQMADGRPFRSRDTLMTAADTIWQNLEPSEWKDAFGHHPKIGDIESLKQKFGSTATWAEGEQSGVRTASDEILMKLAEGNKEYEEKFGYIFIVCATGKSAHEMHLLLEQRLQNDPEHELTITAEEQRKITRIRLEKLLA
ncbi:MAG: 2-oxo-4-hydroxy-4-carboxy-5-ureidoimidazoline decarboxylase [Bacteroidota bacterium]